MVEYPGLYGVVNPERVISHPDDVELFGITPSAASQYGVLANQKQLAANEATFNT